MSKNEGAIRLPSPPLYRLLNSFARTHAHTHTNTPSEIFQNNKEVLQHQLGVFTFWYFVFSCVHEIILSQSQGNCRRTNPIRSHSFMTSTKRGQVGSLNLVNIIFSYVVAESLLRNIKLVLSHTHFGIFEILTLQTSTCANSKYLSFHHM